VVCGDVCAPRTCGIISHLKSTPSGQGEGRRAQIPTGGTARERLWRMTRCDSGADGTVRMGEGWQPGAWRARGFLSPRRVILFGFRLGWEQPHLPRPEADGGARLDSDMNTGDALEHPTQETAHCRPRRWTRALLPVGLVAALAAWQGLTMTRAIPAFLLPSPAAVADRFVRGLGDASLARHTLVTLSEVLAGLFLGVLAAAVLGYWIAKSPSVERLLSPYIVASQAIPIVAIAPLLVIWFGPGRLSKVLISALIVFFPVLVNTVVGVRSVPQDLRQLMRSLRASRRQVFTKLEVPAALPVLLGGLKIGATLSVIGAVVGEFVGADEGLGFLVNIGRGLYDTPLVFVAVFLLIAKASAFCGCSSTLTLFWPGRQCVPGE